MLARFPLAAALGFVLLLGCTSPPPSQATPTPPAAGPALAGCAAAIDVMASLGQFFDAVNSGDSARISSLLSPDFYAYSLTLPDAATPMASTKADAIGHIQSQHLAGDRFDLRSVQVNELQGWDGAAHFGLWMSC